MKHKSGGRSVDAAQFELVSGETRTNINFNPKVAEKTSITSDTHLQRVTTPSGVNSTGGRHHHCLWSDDSKMMTSTHIHNTGRTKGRDFVFVRDVNQF